MFFSSEMKRQGWKACIDLPLIAVYETWIETSEASRISSLLRLNWNVVTDEDTGLFTLIAYLIEIGDGTCWERWTIVLMAMMDAPAEKKAFSGE